MVPAASPPAPELPAAASVALAASELRYRRLFETAQDGILILDAVTGMVVDVNPFLLKLLGYGKEYFLSKRVWELGFFHDIAANAEKFAELQARGYVRYENLPLETADGRTIEVEFVSNVYLVEQARVIQCNIRDVTAHHRAAEALAATQQILNGIFNVIVVRVFWKDTQLKYLGGNLAAARDAGCASPAELIGKDDYQLAWAAQAERMRHDDQQIIGGTLAQLLIEEEVPVADGTTRTVLTSKIPLRDTGGAIVGVIGTYLDITERKQVAAQLQLQGHALEASANAMLITDPAGRTEWCNRAFSELTGYAAAAIQGCDVTRLLKSGKQSPAFYAALWDTVQAGQVWHGELVNRRQDGTLYHEEMTITPVKDEAGVVRHFIAVKQDISKRLALEAQFRQAQKTEAVGRLAGGVAHDFNNMLAVMLGHTELAQEKLPASHPVQVDIRAISEAGLRSADLVRQLLAFARKQTIAPQVVDLNDLVARTLSMLRRLIGEDIELLWKPASGLWLANLDPGQVDQILANLAVNARDAIPGVGTIAIATANTSFDATYCASHPGYLPGDFVELSVRDTGCGMDDATQAQIFEPFFTTKPVGQGTGLGLATVFGIVSQNHGFIKVRSSVGAGSTFAIYLPRHNRTAAATAAAAVVIPPPIGTETILLVEDEGALLRLTQIMLESLHYTVLPAASPAAALKLVQTHAGTIHLLLTDVVMPGLSGRDLQTQLATLRPAMRCLFMSGYTADVIALHGVLEAGIHFLQKPFSRDALARKLRAVLDGR